MRNYFMIILFILTACTKELNIADFSDDFSAYENFYANSPRRNPHSGGKWARAMIRGGTSLYGTPRRCRCAGRYYAEWHDVRTELNGFRLIVPVQGPEVQGSAQGHN